MKAAILLPAITCCAALMGGTCIAGPSNSTEQASSGNRQKTIPQKSTSLDVELRQNKAANDRTVGVRSPSISPSQNLRSHGPRPATIGGPVSTSKNTAVINGTAVKRKP